MTITTKNIKWISLLLVGSLICVTASGCADGIDEDGLGIDEDGLGIDATETGDGDDLCTSPSFEPVAWWRAEGNTIDRIGYHDGEISGNLGYVDGRVGQAFNLLGGSIVTGPVVTVAEDGLYPTGSLTVEAWVSALSAGNVISLYECGDQCLDDISKSMYVLSITQDGHAHGRIRDSDEGGPDDGGQDIEGQTNLLGGDFHHLAFVRDVGNDTLTLYVDGNIDAVSPLHPGAAGSLDDDDGEADPLVIGAMFERNNDVLTGFLTGTIDEAAIYFAALPDADIADIHGAGPDGKCDPYPEREPEPESDPGGGSGGSGCPWWFPLCW